jgi:putative membrane-bound dehydrogenase-like protein
MGTASMPKLVVFSALLFGTATWLYPAAAEPAPGDPGPRSPQDSLNALKARPGFTVELVAAEPLVTDPIAFDWGPDGKLWVVEMGDYPLGLDNKGKPGGRIKFLEDTDGDGKYDKATVFLDNLLFPSGIIAWRKGVLIACAPDIFYAEDTDGDGRADKREVLFTGFGEVNPQHRVNGLRWGLDNWIHCANGDFAQVRDRGPKSAKVVANDPTTRGVPFTKEEDVRRLFLSGANIRSLKTGAGVDIRNRDFRIRPDEGLLDPQTGQAQYGLDRDDWGNWFGCNNARPMWHYVLDDHYLGRNPHVAAPNPRVEAPTSVTFPLGSAGRDTGTVRRPGGNAWTSGCGITIYRDDLFGPEFTGNWFTCEPVHNLVHREITAPVGVTFTSRRADDEQQSEFLASTDTWFSPAMVRTGPDGALWVADIYRKVLEHPNWLPKGWESRVDVRAGHGLGRMYRVFPTGKPPRPVPRLDRLDTAGLVAALDSPNGWQRDTAQQLLLQRRDRAAVPLLERRAAESTRPPGRLHALCTLDGLSALKPAVLRRALTDSHPGIRRHALRLCEALLAQAPDLGAALGKLVSDPDPQVRLQLAYTLGEWDDPQAGKLLGQLLVQDAKDPYLLAAALSSLTKQNLPAVAETVIAHTRHGDPPTFLKDLLGSALGFGHLRVMAALLGYVARPPAQGEGIADWRFAVLTDFLEALDQRNLSLEKLGEEGGAEVRSSLAHLGAYFAAARQTLADVRSPKEKRLLAIRLLGSGMGQHPADLARLTMLLVPQTPEDVQAAVITSLGQGRDPRIGEVLLLGWKSYGPALRSQVLDVLFRREEWLNTFLDALERKQMPASEIDAARRQRLLEHKSPAIHARAVKVFAGLVSPDRQKVVEAYRSALALTGGSNRGFHVFAKHCASCHRLGLIGYAVGPELGMVRDKPPEWFLPAIFDPNQAVEARYVNYLAVTKSGVMLTGVVSNESGNSITLVGPDGKQQVILRTNLEELVSTGKSLMAEGLEKDLKPQDVADVIALLRAGGPPRKVVQGNQPAMVKPAADGTLHLLASNCEIFGSEIKIYDKHQCLGWWNSPEDRAVWTFEVPKAGQYAVVLDYSCDDKSAGQRYVIEAAGDRFAGKVSSTGSWDVYRQERVGEIRVVQGLHRMVVRSDGPLRKGTYLIDLKAVRLKPLPQRE